MNCCLDCLTSLDYVQVLGNEKAAVEVLDLLLCMGMCLCLWYISRSSFYSCVHQAIRTHAQIIPSTDIPQHCRDDNIGRKESSAHGINILRTLIPRV